MIYKLVHRIRLFEKLKFSSILRSRMHSRENIEQLLANPRFSPSTFVDELVKSCRILVFSKTTCPFCMKVKNIFEEVNETPQVIELDEYGDRGVLIQNELKKKTGLSTVPNVFVRTRHLGGCDSTTEALKNGYLNDLLHDDEIFDYDLAVIGGGSGGLAAAKEGAKFGRKVVVFDFVTPTPHGTTWGLGGTCVNVGCIPKKLMHRASIIKDDLEEAPFFGWNREYGNPPHNWNEMVSNVQAHIKSLNFKYRADLTMKKVTYMNALAEIAGPNRISAKDKKGVVKEVSAKNIIIAVGGRPRYPNIPGANYGISSDDIFSLQKHPGKTLLVGASYISLECAGFLHGIGVDVTVLVRSILLRGFDRQMSEMIGKHMQNIGIKFVHGVPSNIDLLESGESNNSYNVKYVDDDGIEGEDKFNTIIFAIGRDACTEKLGLNNVNVNIDKSTKKIIVNDKEETSVPGIFAIGDVILGRPELTPVAIQAGRMLVRRICNKSTELCDYENIPTTVFTPLEYGCVGLSEEDAIAKYGAEDIEVYHRHFQPLEYELSKSQVNVCYGKLICVKSQNEKVVGFHVLSPNAGEITQGFAIGLKLGATISDFQNLVGIHPTCAEWFTTMDITKSSGLDISNPSC